MSRINGKSNAEDAENLGKAVLFYYCNKKNKQTFVNSADT